MAEYDIYSVEDFFKMPSSGIVNLCSDLDFSGEVYGGAGKLGVTFNGIFNGNDFTIKNLIINTSSSYFFLDLNGGTKVNILNFENVQLYGQHGFIRSKGIIPVEYYNCNFNINYAGNNANGDLFVGIIKMYKCLLKLNLKRIIVNNNSSSVYIDTHLELIYSNTSAMTCFNGASYGCSAVVSYGGSDLGGYVFTECYDSFVHVLDKHLNVGAGIRRLIETGNNSYVRGDLNINVVSNVNTGDYFIPIRSGNNICFWGNIYVTTNGFTCDVRRMNGSKTSSRFVRSGMSLVIDGVIKNPEVDVPGVSETNDGIETNREYDISFYREKGWMI